MERSPPIVAVPCDDESGEGREDPRINRVPDRQSTAAPRVRGRMHYFGQIDEDAGFSRRE